jgi:hypothetical protein
MTAFSECIIATAAFLSGGVAATFIMLVIGIHKADRARYQFNAPRSATQALARCALGGVTRRDCVDCKNN